MTHVQLMEIAVNYQDEDEEEEWTQLQGGAPSESFGHLEERS